MTNQDDLSKNRESPPNSDYLTDLISKIMSSSTQTDGSQQPNGVNAENNESPDSNASNAQRASASPDLFSSLLSNPELLAKLPTIISSIKPIMDMFSSQSGAKSSLPASVEPTKPAETVEAGNFSAKKVNDEADRRAALLCAMKPYLGRDRQNAIDYIIKLSRLGDILKSL